MITDNIKWHYLALKSISNEEGFVKPTQAISRLFDKLTSTNTTTEYYCLNCFKSYRTENTLKEHEKVCNKHDYCNIIMPDENHKILKYSQGTRCLKMEYAIYLHLECILSKHDTCANNPNNSYSQTISTHEVSGYSLLVVSKHSDNYQTHYRGIDCMEKLSIELMTIGENISEKEKKNEEPLTANEESEYEKSEYCHICNRKCSSKDEIDKIRNEIENNEKEEDKEKIKKDRKKIKFLENVLKVKDYDSYLGKYRGPTHALCNSRYQEQRKIPVMIPNGSNYDFHLIIKELSKKLKSKMNCIGENTETYKTFSVEIQKEVIETNDNNENKTKVKTYRLSFIDSYSFIKSQLDRLVDNLSEMNNNTYNKCKERTWTTHYYKFVKLHENGLMYKCLNCKNISFKPINELISRFQNTYRMCNSDNEKFVLLLRKGVYPYEYMDNWNGFNETSLPSKDEFYSNLNMTNISDKDYDHANSVWNTININDLGGYHNLYVQSDTALLADVFENFRNVCLKEYKLEPRYFVSSPGLAWTSMLKLTNVKLELLTDVDMLLMFEEGARGGISQAIHKYATANNKYMKKFNKRIISIFLQYLDANKLYGWAMCKNLPIGGFKWVDVKEYSEEKIKNL